MTLSNEVEMYGEVKNIMRDMTDDKYDMGGFGDMKPGE